MAYQLVFKRREVKYLVPRNDVDRLKEAMLQRMRPDEHGRSTLCNVYLDTPDHLLIRRSLEHPLYKEKLRVRSYGVAGPDTAAFIEIKKKYKSTVYKRRVATTQHEAHDYLLGDKHLPDSQVVREIDFFRARYTDLEPAVFSPMNARRFSPATTANSASPSTTTCCGATGMSRSRAASVARSSCPRAASLWR